MHTVITAALVPVKAFHAAKGRLAGVLTDDERALLARWTAGQVLAAVAAVRPHVVCDDDDVAAWAERQGASVIRDEHRGLNGAVDHAVAHLARIGVEHVMVVHGDLPLPEGLAEVAAQLGPGVVTVVPDLHRDGTNVLAFPTTSRFRVAYGPGSFQRHLQIAAACDLVVEVVEHPDLALDIDRPDDLRRARVAAAVAAVLGRHPGTVHDR